ncbi:hypothetical protein VCR15J2_70106 [Vibrio coralliirubri]|uniref:Uncharacterized protein n=1 Tax=Vibrio coralliirubri TaxID=1516159 RepID=A0AA86X0M5_9VIBR|nr:hypothetical protein VCR31J2_1280334 [Vibrio coralliirubri]CDT83028.1 hypothetical protein VCR15J2_70106 [Vibrio coralliirubri]
MFIVIALTLLLLNRRKSMLEVQACRTHIVVMIMVVVMTVSVVVSVDYIHNFHILLSHG